MSCQINLTAKLQDINAIRRCLFPTDDQRGTESWLQLCELSVSPTGDLIVLANERKIVVLNSKWNSQSSLSQYEIIYSGSIHDYDKVKSVLCLPIVGQNGSTAIGPDWTCILVAYDSGYVRFYTENCELLMEEQFHSENITNVKCQSQHSPRPDISSELRPEEIYVQYQSVLCVIDGIQLFTHLKTCRSHLARVQSKGEGLILSPGVVTPRKWAFQDQSIIHDSVVAGLNLSSTFDHLLTASNCGGFETKYRAMPPHNTLVLAAGSKPFLGYHYALEGAAQPVLSDIAKVVTNKLKSALPGWLTGGRPVQEKQVSLATLPAESMGCRFGLCDLRRTATNIILSPDRKLAAVCDALGRVLLIDSFRGITLKIFKGYRDAQCSFIQVPDERKSKPRLGNKVAHFLAIYSSKKGTLEVFTVQEGAKIVTFNASKYSRLVYINYNLMGFTTNSKSKYVSQFTTVFIDNDGQIKEILIPFHLALAEKNSKKARDIHLYKKLRHLIKSGNYSKENLLNAAYDTCTELKTIEIKNQIIDMLISTSHMTPEVILKCADYFKENLGEEGANLKIVCENVSALINLYLFLSFNGTDEENGNLVQPKHLSLNLEAKEMKNLQKLLDLSLMNDKDQSPELHVRFHENVTYSVSEYLSVFELTNSENLSLKTNLDENLLFRTSEVLFKPYIVGDVNNYDQLQSEIIKSGMSIKSLFHLLVNYWVNKPLKINLNLEKQMNSFTLLIFTVMKATKENLVLTEYSQISRFWSEVRNVLANSSRPFPALIAAILCKHVAHTFENDEQMNNSGVGLEDDNIEILSQENIEWSLLIGKLEDVSLLNIILSTKCDTKEAILPKLQHEQVDVSLKNVLEQGRGSVSELVGQWLTTSGIDPHRILNEKSVDDLAEHPDQNPPLCDEKIMEKLKLLREQFPYSLEGSVLLANMAWEYSVAWQKDIQNLGYLEAAIKCLNHIQNLQLKKGLFQLMWNIHLKIVNESVCKLINKVGKLPKERLCKQDTGLTDYQISLFISITTDFLDKFMEASQEGVNIPHVDLKFENIWENDSSRPLVELAVKQQEVNYDLLHLHYQLSLVLQMITTFSVKHSKPVNSLFEPSLANLFFSDMQRKMEINWNKSDIKINFSRNQFLFKIISASLESVTVNENSKIYSTEHVTWMSRCLMLGRLWNLDVDVLRRYQVIQLYGNGFDSLADELVSAVNDLNELGVNLLKIAVKRLSQFLTSSPDLSENIAALSPYLTKYMGTMDDEWCAPSPLPGITNLAIQTIRCLNEEQSEFKLAQLLLDTCNTLEEIRS